MVRRHRSPGPPYQCPWCRTSGIICTMVRSWVFMSPPPATADGQLKTPFMKIWCERCGYAEVLEENIDIGY